MKRIVLHGRLAQDFGESFRLDVSSVPEAVRALEANFPGRFTQALREGSYRVGRNADDPGLTQEQLPMLLGSDEIHIEPIIAGSNQRGKGLFNTVLGIALIAVAFYYGGPAGSSAAAGGVGAGWGATAFTAFGTAVTWGSVAMMGFALALSGVSTLLMSAPEIGDLTDSTESFLFGGPENVTVQGGPVPLVYGQVLVGSVVVGASLSVERLVAPSATNYNTGEEWYGGWQGSYRPGPLVPGP